MKRSIVRLTAFAMIPCLIAACATSPEPMSKARNVAVSTLATPPKATSIPATDRYPGFEIIDPYRNLENLDDADTQAWMKAQADPARIVLDAIPERPALRAGMDVADALRAYVIGNIVRATADRTFFMRRDANTPTGKLYVRDGSHGEGRLLFDPSQRDTESLTHAISWYVPSPSGKRVAIAVAANGSEMAEFDIIAVDSGAVLEGAIQRSWLGIVNWIDDEQLLLGRMRDIPADADPADAWLESQVYLHRVGTPIAQDVHVFGTQLKHAPHGLPPQDFVGAKHRPGEPYALAIAVGARAHFAAWSLPAEELGNPDARWLPLFLEDARNAGQGSVLDGQLYVISTQSANGEIVKYDMATGESQTLRAASDKPIESLGMARDGLYFRERNGVYTTLKRIDHDGNNEIAVRFPRKGNPSPATDDYTHPELDGAMVSLGSWTEPDAIFLVHADGEAREVGLSAPVHGMDLSQLHVRDLVATSHDGTKVPLTLLHAGDLKPASEQPVLLAGYGSYGISMDPFFSHQFLAFQQQGIAPAICHVRGGGEFGSAWHEGGRLATKANTWKDFIACAQALIEQGFTVPEKLVGMGTSAGGITIINAVVEQPELFAGAINDVGVADVLRSLSASRNGPNHYAENGDYRTLEGAAIARAMSGYEKIEAGKRYPHWLVIHGANDPRVEVWQSNKFVARMQAASDRPVIFRLDYASGHGMGSSADARKDWAADIGSFVLDVTRADTTGGSDLR